MHRWWILVLLLGFVPWNAADAQRRSERNRPIRVGNTNVFVVGGGYRAHDHPSFERKGFVNLAYQRRILRRELRLFPVWARAALDFKSEARDFSNSYSVWNAREVAGGNIPFPERLVQERTSDLALRFELLADLLHSRNAALYGGGGFVVHIVSFSSRGTETRNTFESSENFLGPSLVAGGRLFMAKQPWTIYGESRLGRVHGRLDRPPDEPFFTDQTFEYISRNAVSFEGGIGFHW